MRKITNFFGRQLSLFSQIKETVVRRLYNLLKNELLQDDHKIADELNTFFKNAVLNLNKNENTYIINHDSGSLSDPVDKAICKYKFHLSILLIKSKLENQKLFLFQPKSKFDMEKEIQNIDLKKATTKNTIPPKILKISCNTSAEILHNLFYECLITGNFLDNLKLADTSSVFKKKDPLNKENYRPVGVLPSISYIFEKLMQKQINGYINLFLSPYLCSYRKGFSTQLALSLTEKWKKGFR